MNKLKLSLCIGLTFAAGTAFAGGPLIVTDESGTIKPLVWDTTQGPIPVYTDGGGAFTYDFDGVTPFITIERANEITAHAFAQWSQVPTSTFEATIQGTIESQTGVADVDSSNVADYIGVQNGPGFWVIYDTDGSIMEDFFGVSPGSVLGISSPEWSDGSGHIIESWTVMNGWPVNIDDDGFPDVADAIFRADFEKSRRGERYAGVFTHEIGHAINLSHSQVNGDMVYNSFAYAPFYPGVPGCVDPLFSYHDTMADPSTLADPASIETMYPFIDTDGIGGKEQASIDVADDMTAISNLYPSADYQATTGTITGTLRLKDGSTPYSGINIIARPLGNPLAGAISAMSGDATQGLLGPDGSFTFKGLVAGEQYQVYIEAITAGGYPTTPQMMLSQGEYWNTGEGNDPATDLACNVTPITAAAGTTDTADITFNGYLDGVQFTPLVNAYMSSLSTDGTRAGGSTAGGTVALLWDRAEGIKVLPVWFGTYNGDIDGAGTRMAVQVDPDGNGISEVAIWDENGPLRFVGDMNDNTCGGSSQSGSDAAVAMGMDDTASTLVGLAYVDRDGNGSCGGGTDEIVPFIWTAAGGMRELPHDPTLPWTRANEVSGDGNVVVGVSNFQHAWGWVGEGAPVDLTTLTGAMDVNAVNQDGTVVPMSGMDEDFKGTGIVLWNALQGSDPSAFTNIDSLRYCVDLPYKNFFGDNLCDTMTPQEAYDQLGVAPVNVFGINDAGTVLVGRAGDFFAGWTGAIWVKDVGWKTMMDFLHAQGVVEADAWPIDNPGVVSGEGDIIMGGIAGLEFTWLIDLEEVYVCKNGVSTATTFPDGLRTEIRDNGALFGRCEFIDP